MGGRASSTRQEILRVEPQSCLQPQDPAEVLLDILENPISPSSRFRGQLLFLLVPWTDRVSLCSSTPAASRPLVSSNRKRAPQSSHPSKPMPKIQELRETQSPSQPLPHRNALKSDWSFFCVPHLLLKGGAEPKENLLGRQCPRIAKSSEVGTTIRQWWKRSIETLIGFRKKPDKQEPPNYLCEPFKALSRHPTGEDLLTVASWARRATHVSELWDCSCPSCFRWDIEATASDSTCSGAFSKTILKDAARSKSARSWPSRSQEWTRSPPSKVVINFCSALQRHGEVDSTLDCTRLRTALQVALCAQRILAQCTAPHPDPR